MRALVAFPTPASFSIQVALAFEEREMLSAFFTTFGYHQDSGAARAIRALPGSLGHRLDKELARRSVTDLRIDSVETRPTKEVLRTLASKLGLGEVMVDRIWDWEMHDFTRAAGRRLQKGDTDVVYAYEYSALEAFQEAKRLGIATILDCPSLSSRQFEKLKRQQKIDYPELRNRNDAYFEPLFETRQRRRDTEIALADMIVTNSSVTKASHVEAGAPPDKTFVVNLAAPPSIEAVTDKRRDGPLRVIWAGAFSLGKAAHLFLEAWSSLPAGKVVADVYGAVKLPERMIPGDIRNISYHGHVLQSTLWSAFESADVLIFPTLSDGFGMVVTEAMSRGLPVISTNKAGASDLIRHGENGLVISAGDVNAIKESLNWCIEHRSALVDMRSSALATARNWQWSDYRRMFIETVTKGLSQAGYPTP